MAHRASPPRFAPALLLVPLIAAALVAVATPAAGVPRTTTYIAPVDAPVALTFRPPTHHYGGGNRGVDYATRPGDDVWAAAPGVVVFAGSVGRSIHVVVLHHDGIRTTYGFLAKALVRRGQAVRAGDVVGEAGGQTHFGARAGNAYLDPLVLLRGGSGRVHLVPADARPHSEAEERGALEQMVGGLVRLGRSGIEVTAAAADWARRSALGAARGRLDGLRAYAQFALSIGLPLPTVLRFIEAAAEWASRACTPVSDPPPRIPERRIVVLVGGYRSSSEGAGVEHVDTEALGYAKEDRFRFSYRGGTTDDQPYWAEDTEGDINEAGGKLAALLRQLGTEHPGVPIDVIAHSLGGVVTRVAIDELKTSSVPVSHVVTLASPHRGADGASALAVLNATPGGQRAVEQIALAGGLPDPGSVVGAQLAVGSPFMRGLEGRGWGHGVRVTSIAGRSDVVVPSPRCFVDGATNVTVAPDGANDHNELPGSASGQREMALALNDHPPTCETLADVWSDVAHGDVIVLAEGGLGLVAGALGSVAPPVPPVLGSYAESR